MYFVGWILKGTARVVDQKCSTVEDFISWGTVSNDQKCSTAQDFISWGTVTDLKCSTAHCFYLGSPTSLPLVGLSMSISPRESHFTALSGTQHVDFTSGVPFHYPQWDSTCRFHFGSPISLSSVGLSMSISPRESHFTNLSGTQHVDFTSGVPLRCP